MPLPFKHYTLDTYFICCVLTEMGDLREAKTDRIFTMDEVRQHNKEDDAWLVVDEVVYDISNFWKKHPGGQNVIFNYAGMDATVRH